MKLRRLQMHRMPGFDQGGPLLNGLSGGLNLIVGPNASGKTTVCRAIQGLLWPETLLDAAPVSLLGEWDEEGRTLRIEIEGNRASWQRDGVAADPPPVPGMHLANCFTVTIDDLFGGSDADLARQIAREMAGGYDLRAVRQSPPFKLGALHGSIESKAHREVQQRVQTIRKEHEALRAEERELAKLHEAAEQARLAEGRLKRLQEVRDLLEVRGSICQTVALLEKLPPGMDRLRGNEEEAITGIEVEIKRLQAEGERALQAADDARRRVAQARLPEGAIPDVRLAEQETRLEALRDAETEWADIEKQLRQTDAGVQDALRLLGGVAPPEVLDAINVAGLNEIEDFHRSVEKLHAERTALQARLAAIGPPSEGGSPEDLAKAVGALREWLEAAAAPGAPGALRTALAFAPGVLLGMAALVLTIAVNPWWVLLLGPAAAAAWAAWTAGHAQRPHADARAACRTRYARVPVEPPAEWTVEAVGRRINELEKQLAAAHRAEQLAEEAKSCRALLAGVEQAEAPLAERRRALVARCGISPPVSDLALVLLVVNLRQYQAARTERDALRREHQASGEVRARLLEQVNAFLREFGEPQCGDYRMARAHTKDLAARARACQEARRDLARAEKAADQARELSVKVHAGRAGAFAAAGLQDGDEASLQDRMERLPDYRKLSKELVGLSVQEETLNRKLKDAPDLLEMDAERLDGEAARIEAIAGERTALLERGADIRARVDRAGRETRLEEALAGEDRALEALRRRREEAEFAAAAGVLIGRVGDEHEMQSRPPVLKQAATWFSLFTRGRYELKVAGASSDAAAFRAVDTTARRGLALDELSRGTRMQLLLAVRLAFAASAERGAALPFVLDEVLSSSDPVRFRAIVECLLALVKEGRQVFYLTCQPGDAAAWNTVAEEMGVAGAVRIELTDTVPRGAAESALLGESTVQAEGVPAPEGRTLDEYARALGVPEMDPASGSGPVHVAHLVESAASLHGLLAAGIECYGALDNLARHGGADAYVPADELARMRARAGVLDAFAEAWAVGRGRPLSREVLLAAGVSDSFIDRVCALAADAGWDAKRVLAALEARQDERAKRFHSSALETMVQRLTDSGHLDPREPLDRPSALSRVLAAAADHVRGGSIDPAEVQRLFDRLWEMASAAQGGRLPPRQAPAEGGRE